MTTAAVNTLGEFTEQVGKLRGFWGLPATKELWFRGESRDYGATKLRPELYRPAVLPDKSVLSLKPIQDLLVIENDLHDEFERNAEEYLVNSRDDWHWDCYFLMQHHEGPTRLLDWSDGALIALHFALRNKSADEENACVYVLEPSRLQDSLMALPDKHETERAWKDFCEKHPHEGYDPSDWDASYLPVSKENMDDVPVPRSPLVLDFGHITRRIAAQRSRFIVLGTEPNWIQDEFTKPDSCIRVITIHAKARAHIRQELRDCGITESVIFPDLDGIGREMKQLWEDRRVAP